MLEPEFEPPRELRIEKMWDWTGQSWGGLPDGTSLVDRRHRVEQIRCELQKTLLPEHASEVLGINDETGEYVMAPTKDDVYEAFHARWPDRLTFIVRVDGGPVTEFHGE